MTRRDAAGLDHEAAFRACIADIRDYEPGADPQQVAAAFGIPLNEIVKLASNENSFPIPPAVAAAIQGQLPLLSTYPGQEYVDLRAAVAAANGVPATQVVLSSGSAQLVLDLPLLYTDPGDEVILAPQSYALYEAASQVMAAGVRHVPLVDFRFDVPGIVAAINERTKIIWLCSPNNPTGATITWEEMHSLLSAVPLTTAVVVDEAYSEFADRPDYADGLDFLKAGHRNVIVLRSFSKAYALAGLRLGYALADAAVCRMLDRISEPFFLSRAACAAGLAALADTDWLQSMVRAVKEEREYLARELTALRCDVLPSQGNFVLVDVHRDCRRVFRQLLAKGVIVRPADGWGYPSHLRVTVGTREQNDRFLAVLRDLEP